MADTYISASNEGVKFAKVKMRFPMSHSLAKKQVLLSQWVVGIDILFLGFYAFKSSHSFTPDA